MTEPLENAIEQIVNTLRTVSGLRNVPVNPPETMSYDVFAVVYAFSGSIDIAPIGSRKALHQIAIDVLTKRIDISKSIATLKPLIDTVSNVLLAEVSTGGTIFNNSISTFSNLTYNWVSVDYGGVPVVGYHFMMVDVKILVNL
jgi:hypothetical protein